MLKKIQGTVVDRMILPVGGALARAHVTPNQLTVAGAFIVGWGAWLVAQGRLVPGGWVLLGGMAFDLLDGAVARGGGMRTERGAFLDSTLDRLTDALMFSALILHLERPWSWVALAALVLSMLTSYIKARAEGLGYRCDVGLVERAERVLIVIAGLVFGFIEAALTVLTALALITVLQRFVHVYRQVPNERS